MSSPPFFLSLSLSVVSHIPGLRGGCGARPQPAVSGHLPELSVLLPQRRRGGEQEAQLLLRHLVRCRCRPHHMVRESRRRRDVVANCWFWCARTLCWCLPLFAFPPSPSLVIQYSSRGSCKLMFSLQRLSAHTVFPHEIQNLLVRRLSVYLSILYVCLYASFCFPICILVVFRVPPPGLHACQSTSLLKYPKLLFPVLQILIVCHNSIGNLLYSVPFDEISLWSVPAETLLPLRDIDVVEISLIKLTLSTFLHDLWLKIQTQSVQKRGRFWYSHKQRFPWTSVWTCVFQNSSLRSCGLWFEGTLAQSPFSSPALSLSQRWTKGVLWTFCWQCTSVIDCDGQLANWSLHLDTLHQRSLQNKMQKLTCRRIGDYTVHTVHIRQMCWGAYSAVCYFRCRLTDTKKTRNKQINI